MGFTDTKLPDNEIKYLSLIENLFPKDVPIKINIRLEGMKIDNGEMKLGCRAGPSISIHNLLHEIGHLIDIDDARATSYGWGL